jgi:hypothetical protein
LRWPRARPPAAAVPSPQTRSHWSWWSSSGGCGAVGAHRETAPPEPTRRRGGSGGGGGRGGAGSGARGIGTPSSTWIPVAAAASSERREIRWIFFAWFGFASSAGVLLFSWKADEPLKHSFLFVHDQLSSGGFAGLKSRIGLCPSAQPTAT